MEAWLWLIAWTVMMYLFGLYLFRSWQARRRQRQDYLWRQIGFYPDLKHQAGKTGIAVETATGRVALRDQNNLGVFEPGDILTFSKSAAVDHGDNRYFLDIRINDQRKPDWRVTFERNAPDRDAFYDHLRSIMPEKAAADGTTAACP